MTSTPMIEPLNLRVARLASIHTAEIGLKLHFIGADIEVDEHTTTAELLAAECVLPDYTAGGYAIVYSEGGITADGVAYNFSAALGFTVLTSGTPGSVYGCWIEGAGVANQRVRFPNPVPCDAVGKQCLVIVYDGYPPGEVGVEVVLP
jgi:hypothetical protein